MLPNITGGNNTKILINTKPYLHFNIHKQEIKKKENFSPSMT
jgi:hypothetical protein